MDEARHKTIPVERLLPYLSPPPYAALMPAQPTNLRRIRADQELWDAYENVVGDGGRSADLRAYMEWRIENPTMPLPGRRRGPVRKVRQKSGDAET